MQQLFARGREGFALYGWKVEESSQKSTLEMCESSEVTI
jgi:hypothetical protein